MSKFKSIGQKIGEHVDLAQRAYGDSFGKSGAVLRVMLDKYRNDDGTYTIPDDLLDSLLTIVRVVDKLFRICSNPSGDLMNESPWFDISGYGILECGKHDDTTK